MRYIKYIFGGICVSYFPAIFFVASQLMPTSDVFWMPLYLLNLLAVFLISVPYYFAFVQIGLFLSHWFGKRDAEKYKTVLSLIELTAAISSIIFATIGFVIESTLSPLALWSSIFLIGFWIAEAIIKMIKKEKFLLYEGFKWKSFLLCTFVVTVIACLGIFTVFQINEHKENEKIEEYTSRFEVWHNTPTIVCKRGECGKIEIHLKSNVLYEYSGSYSDFRPHAMFIYGASNTKYAIHFDELSSTDDYGSFTIYEGEVRDTMFYFTVPEDAPLGSYNIEMWFSHTKNIQEGVLLVVE